MGNYAELFDREENRQLLAIGVRHQIRAIGIGGIIWGVINIGLGIVFMQQAAINVCVLLLGVLMMGAGIYALIVPRLNTLLLEAAVAFLLLGWNIFVLWYNFKITGKMEPNGGLFWTAIFAIGILSRYLKLSYLKQAVADLTAEEVKNAKAICKAIWKLKPKDEPELLQTANKQCRLRRLEDGFFLVHRDLRTAYQATGEELLSLIEKPEAKKIAMKIKYPLGDLQYKFDPASSETLREWLGVTPPQTETA